MRTGCKRVVNVSADGSPHPAANLSPADADSLVEIVRHEPAAVVGDAAVVLAHADTGGFSADDPRSDKGMVAFEHRQWGIALPDEALGAVVSGSGVEQAGYDNGHVMALAAENRLFHVGAAQVTMLVLEGRQEIGVAGKALPQQRQQQLVR